MTKEIELTQGFVALVDDEDYEKLNGQKWCIDLHDRCAYVVRVVQVHGKQRKVYMHREIVGAKPGQLTDHVNGDGLDNRRCNLRICSKAQNACNFRMHHTNTSGFRGVYWNAARGKWKAQIRVNGRITGLGRFVDIVDAALAYDDVARKYRGEFAQTNFIEV